MIYLLAAFCGAILFLLGLVIGYISPLGVKAAVKRKAAKRSQSLTEREIHNFSNYDGSPQP